MNIKNYLKHILFKCPESFIHTFYALYNYFYYFNNREIKKEFGSLNPNINFYVIRPRPNSVQGLMSIFMETIKQINYSIEKGYVPIVDFQNYKTQYNDLKQKEKNVWEYYFKQISNYTLEEVYKSKNVYLSGLNSIELCPRELNQRFDKQSMVKVRNIIKKYIVCNNAVNDFVNTQLNEMNLDIEKTIGLYLRGTDYTKLKPAGHQKQPSMEEAFKQTDIMLEKTNFNNVFLVTEDMEIYKHAKEYYGNKLKSITNDKFISNYSGKDFLINDKNSIEQLSVSPYERGLIYLGKILILSKCSAIVAGNTSGSWGAFALSNGFKYEYVFDLGKY